MKLSILVTDLISCTASCFLYPGTTNRSTDCAWIATRHRSATLLHNDSFFPPYRSYPVSYAVFTRLPGLRLLQSALSHSLLFSRRAIPHTRTSSSLSLSSDFAYILNVSAVLFKPTLPQIHGQESGAGGLNPTDDFASTHSLLISLHSSDWYNALLSSSSPPLQKCYV